MFSAASIVSLSCCLVILVFLRWLYSLLSRVLRGETGHVPFVHYRKDSRVCEEIVQSCSTLTERYTPPLLWGTNGHIQTTLFGVMGRFSVPHVGGERHSVTVEDGSTVLYDLFRAQEPSSVIFIVCPGIGNSSESNYIRAFAHYVTSNNHHVAVLNHMGALKKSPLTGNRIFSYGGTGDLAAMFQDLLSVFPSSRFVAVGFSLGGNIVVRFMGEREEWRKHFVCAISVGQGYDPNCAAHIVANATPANRFILRHVTKQHLARIRRHSKSLLGGSLHKHKCDPQRRRSSSDIVHDGHDCNGFSLDPEKISPPNEELMWTATNLHEVDEYYTRRVLGFASVRDMWQWMSCVELMYRVTDFPLLFVNSSDDPVVPPEMHTIPMQYTDLNPCAMFVRTQYGGHLGFFEGGVVRANAVSWIDRLILQYARACSEILPTCQKS